MIDTDFVSFSMQNVSQDLKKFDLLLTLQINLFVCSACFLKCFIWLAKKNSLCNIPFSKLRVSRTAIPDLAHT